MEKHITLTGETLEYPRPAPEVAVFLARVVDMANNPHASESEMVNLIYGSDNPILDQTIFPSRGAVTKAVFKDPIYHVMLDLLDHKRVQVGTLDLNSARAMHTMTVKEAAEQLGISTSAVRQAIGARRLPAFKQNGQYWLDPQSVASYRVSRRGPKPQAASDQPHPS